MLSCPIRGALFALGALSAAGCTRIDVTLHVLNGATGEADAATVRAAVPHPLPTEGVYVLSPSTMTLTVTGIGFVGAGGDPDGAPIAPVDDCTATYDRALGSLVSLGACGAQVAPGRYDGLILRFSDEAMMVVDDSEVGIFSDPDAPGGLVATRPEGGPRPIPVVDQNSGGQDTHARLFFSDALELSEESAPEVFVVFDPTHWMKSNFQVGQFSEPYAAGNPPVLPSLDGFAKASYYTNLGSAGSYLAQGCTPERCLSLLFLYADVETPHAVTWQDHAICPPLHGGNAPVVSFAGDDLRWGQFGRLGLDAEGVLAWASGEHASGQTSEIASYTGVYRMPEVTTPGGVVTLAYRCTDDVPAPEAGDTYASGAPAFEADGTLTLTLLY